MVFSCLISPTLSDYHWGRKQTCEKLKARPRLITANCSDVHTQIEKVDTGMRVRLKGRMAFERKKWE